MFVQNCYQSNKQNLYSKISIQIQNQHYQQFKKSPVPSKLTAPSTILVSLELPLTPDGVSGRMSGDG